MKLPYTTGGDTFDFECQDNWVSKYTNEGILHGETYPILSFIRDVHVVLDIGANCGAATVFFATHYPDAIVHAFEPAEEPFSLLERNTQPLGNVRRHHLGLFSHDDQVPLYRGAFDSGSSSVFKRAGTLEKHEVITLRSTSAWLHENAMTSVDIVKIDTEGCEIPILTAMRDLLPTVKVLYIEFHNEEDRKTLDQLLGDTHVMVHGKTLLNIGEVVYVARDAFPAGDLAAPEVHEWMAAIVRRRVANRSEATELRGP